MFFFKRILKPQSESTIGEGFLDRVVFAALAGLKAGGNIALAHNSRLSALGVLS